jgi:hypothetical protein
VNKRSTGKAWGVIFVCTSTSLAHVEIAETYSTESFLMAVRRFMALHGVPKRFQSDQGTQLVAASKQLARWDWTAVHELAERESAECTSSRREDSIIMAGLSPKLTVVVMYTFISVDVSPPLHMTRRRFCAIGSASTLW